MAKVAPPHSLDTWFTFVGDTNPTLPFNIVTVIKRSDGSMVAGLASEQDWADVYAWTFGDQT